MNQKLLEARRKFRGQKGIIEKGGGFNTVPAGVYTCRVTESSLRGITFKDVELERHSLTLTVELGDQKGQKLSPFPPTLEEVDGIQQCATNIQRILGDVIPGENKSGGFEIDYDGFLLEAEDLIAKCEGELVEVTVKAGKKDPDRMNVYINRGLGDDVAGLAKKENGTTHSMDDDLDYGIKKTRGKKTAKKVVKKKVRRKKK